MSTMNYESTMLSFDGNNYLTTGNQVDTCSSGYYNQISGNDDISALIVFDEQDSPKASYILAYRSTII